jgi:hypothetical protein
VSLFVDPMEVNRSERERIDPAVKSDPWAFIDATLNSGERPLQNMMDWIEARHAEHKAEETLK